MSRLEGSDYLSRRVVLVYPQFPVYSALDLRVGVLHNAHC